MRPFKDVTTDGTEKALRRGRVVPAGDVNLAYVKSPEISPQANVVVVDTSRAVQENIARSPQLYVANEMGELSTLDGNISIPDEYPVVTDVFSADGTPLPYVHISRYFYAGRSGLSAGNELAQHYAKDIKIVDDTGKEYNHYSIRITAAKFDVSPVGNVGSWLYRIHAFIDTPSREDLYLQYNKAEVGDGNVAVNLLLDHQEILNPEPFFAYVPEESEVIDPANRDKKIYSTKLIAVKEKLLDKPFADSEGYKAIVPKKAISDPRIYQTFRWRLNCTFIQDVNTRIVRGKVKQVNCGVIVTSQDLESDVPSRAAYSLYNLAHSRYNSGEVEFRNPLQEDHTLVEQRKADYWFVNLDEDNLSQYDFLVWAPSKSSIDVSQYVPKINDFTENIGGTVFIDSGNWTDFGSSLGLLFSAPFHPASGSPRGIVVDSSSPIVSGDLSTIGYVDATHNIIDGNARLGGWDLIDEANNNPPIDFLTHYQRVTGAAHMQYMADAYDVAIIDIAQGGNRYPVLVEERSAGSKFISTLDIAYTTSALFAPGTGVKVSDNFGDTIAASGQYQDSVDSLVVEGAMKLIYNMALSAVKLRSINDAEDDVYSTSWTFSTPWKASWVIDASDNTLDRTERDRFNFLIDAKDIYAETPDTTPIWKRRLSSKTVEAYINEALEPLLSNPATANRVAGSNRQYSVEITNPNVQASSKILAGDYLNVWTEAYSPKFTIPADLGRHIIREEMDNEGNLGRALQYDSRSYSVTDYPDKQYRGRIIASYNESEELTKKNMVNYTATGRARVTTVNYVTSTHTEYVYNANRLTVGEDETVQQVASTSYRDINWLSARPSSIEEVGNYLVEGSRWLRNYSYPEYGVIRPKTIRTWQADNYYDNPSQCWPYWGISERLEVGSQGDVVYFFQDAYNRFVRAGFLSGDPLVVDGFYGNKTSQAAYNLQQSFQAIYQDSIVDAETWFILGSQILRLYSHGHEVESRSTNWTRFYNRAKNLDLSRISDGRTDTWIAKHSQSIKAPDGIREFYQIRLDRRYVITGMNIMPYLEGDTTTLDLDLIDVIDEDSLSGYDPSGARMKDLRITLEKDKNTFIPIGPINGSSIVIGISQNGPSGRGNSKFLGIRDIRLRVRGEDETEVLSDDPGVLVQPIQTSVGRYATVPAGGTWSTSFGAVVDPNALSMPVLEPITHITTNYNETWAPTGFAVYAPGSEWYNTLIDDVNAAGGSVTSEPITYEFTPKPDSRLVPQDAQYVTSYSYYYFNDDGWIVHDTLEQYSKPKTKTVTVTTPVYSTANRNFSISGTVEVETLKSKTIQVRNPSFPGSHSVSGITFQGITTDDSLVSASITSSGRATFFTFAFDSRRGSGIKEGAFLPSPGTEFYSMDTDGRVTPIPEAGYVSKADGIKLLCDASGNPYGFPELPTGVGANEHQRHYSKLSLLTQGSDGSVHIGFYDRARKEFVASKDGSLQMSYIDYARRGPQNIYVGVINDYEQTYENIMPAVEEDSPRIPYKWAMPIYGVQNQSGSRIAIEPLPPRLGKHELWPVVVRDGSFSRYVSIRGRQSGPLQGWASGYQDSIVRAFYSIPEARSVGYSDVFGPPNADIIAEEPIVLDDNIIQVRQAPILTYIQPTDSPGPADPRRLALTLYRRASRSSPWYELPYSQIRDYNSSTGEIFLVDPVYTNDPGLLKVNYTATRAGYHLKKYQNLILNLNPYYDGARKLVGETISIYMVPEYVKDSDGFIIPESVQQQTLRASLSSDVFNSQSPDYDPLAVQLGVVYLTSSFDISDLAVLDTRRRGGGLRDNANMREVSRIMNDSWHYWDIQHGTGESYPKSGYIVVRLPKELKDSLPQQEIDKVISRNITAGSAFKIETLQGEDWSDL